jgi:hypothetical protein
MIFDKARMAKLSGLMTESKGGIKDPMADQFGGGKDEGDPWLDGDVTTEGAHGDDDEGMMHMEDSMDSMEGMDHEPMEARRKKGEDAHMEARRKKGHDNGEEDAVREMIRTELRKAKKDLDDEKAEESAVREAVRKEIRSVMRSRGATMGGVGWGFKR